MKTVFTLASGRSGTSYLCGLLRRNTRRCVVRHEPYLDRGNPTMFGRPIFDHSVGDVEAVRELLGRKRRRIGRYAPRVYIETSHAFLKSYWDLAPEFFPEMRLVHLIRDPLAVARSEANREAFAHRYRLPFRHYRGGDGKKYFRWSLTGREPIFAALDPAGTSRFQWYLAQWIEIENRAMKARELGGAGLACFTMRSPDDLNDAERVAALIRFLDLELAGDTAVLGGRRNRTPGRPTIVGRAEERECREVIRRVPGEYLEIFRHEPYRSFDWSRWLRK